MVTQELKSRMRILIFFANTYDMPAEPGRDAMKGCSVHYFFLGDDGKGFSPIQNYAIDEAVGYQRGKVSMEYSMRAKIPCAPGIYDGDFVMSVGGDGKPVVRLVDVQFIAPFDVSASFAQALGFGNAAAAEAPAAAPTDKPAKGAAK